jgi:hypothetical protein
LLTDKTDKTNRPLRQDKKALNNAVNWANNPSLDNSKIHGTSVNTNAPRHQRDLEERKNRQNRQNRENRETREPRDGSYIVDKPAKQYMEFRYIFEKFSKMRKAFKKAKIGGKVIRQTNRDKRIVSFFYFEI